MNKVWIIPIWSMIDDVDVPLVLGNISTLPGANPVQTGCFEQFENTVIPPMISPIVVYTSTAGMPSPTLPPRDVVTPAQTLAATQNVSPQGTCTSTGTAKSGAGVNNLVSGLEVLKWAIGCLCVSSVSFIMLML
jgi:hypothetical protein